MHRNEEYLKFIIYEFGIPNSILFSTCIPCPFDASRPGTCSRYEQEDDLDGLRNFMESISKKD